VADGDDRRIVGTVMLQLWPHAGEVVTGPGEAEIRALAVAPDGQGRGTGRALLRAVIERAALTGVRHLVLLTQPEMQTAQRIYRRAGFVRLPERDWSPRPGVILLAYGLVLAPGGQASGWSADGG
jgi:ribosomal protein S18 acetylase RimI-like enzyme